MGRFGGGVCTNIQPGLGGGGKWGGACFFSMIFLLFFLLSHDDERSGQMYCDFSCCSLELDVVP